MKLALILILSSIAQLSVYGAGESPDISYKPINNDQREKLIKAKEAAEKAISASKNSHCKSVAQRVLSGSGYSVIPDGELLDINANRMMMAYKRAFVNARSDNTRRWDKDANIDSSTYRDNGMWKASEDLFDRIFANTKEQDERLPTDLKYGAVGSVEKFI